MAFGNEVKKSSDSEFTDTQPTTVTPSLQKNEVKRAVPTGSLQSPSQLADVTNKTNICPFQALADKRWLTLNACTKPGACHFSFSTFKTVYYFALKAKVSFFTHSANLSTKADKKREVFTPVYINQKRINRNF